ncbi:MAG: hypothetical protein ABR500_01645 [Dermatophilaceae bacterium]|nr:hypothetical protein [Intrasporangiaceae bacterium]
MARHPRLVAIAGTVALLALASPALGLTLGQPDDGNRSVGHTTRTASDRLTEGFGPGFNVITVIPTTSPQSTETSDLATKVGGSLWLLIAVVVGTAVLLPWSAPP